MASNLLGNIKLSHREIGQVEREMGDLKIVGLVL